MTAIDVLHRVLDGHAVTAAMLDEEVSRLVILAAMLRTDASLRSVSMRPAARIQLRDRLLVRAGRSSG